MNAEKETLEYKEIYEGVELQLDLEKLSKFEKNPPPKNKVLIDKKYNFKIRNHDLLLLDTTANILGLSRSALITQLIERFLEKNLMAIEEYDVKAMIALLADGLAGNNGSHTGTWKNIVTAPGSNLSFDFMLNYNSPNEFCPDDKVEYHSASFGKVNDILNKFLESVQE